MDKEHIKYLSHRSAWLPSMTETERLRQRLLGVIEDTPYSVDVINVLTKLIEELEQNV